MCMARIQGHIDAATMLDDRLTRWQTSLQHAQVLTRAGARASAEKIGRS